MGVGWRRGTNFIASVPGAVNQRWNWVTFCEPAIQGPGNPATRRPSDRSIMNSKCRLMCEEVFSGQRILIIIRKSKSSLHGLTSSDFSPTTDIWQWLLSFQHFKCKFCILGIFSNTGKTLVSHRLKMMTQTWKVTQMTHWLSSMSAVNSGHATATFLTEFIKKAISPSWSLS